jgi:hypothetical protein
MHVVCLILFYIKIIAGIAYNMRSILSLKYENKTELSLNIHLVPRRKLTPPRV